MGKDKDVKKEAKKKPSKTLKEKKEAKRAKKSGREASLSASWRIEASLRELTVRPSWTAIAQKWHSP